MDAVSQYALAYALTTSAGIRALLPLTALAFAAHFGWVQPPESFAWLGGTLVMWILAGVASLELLADKVPVIDHALHFVQLVSKPAAAAILVGGSVHATSHEQLVMLMVLGALNALGIHGAVAGTRVASTASTGGFANPLLSLAEDAGAIGSVVIAFLAPLVAAALAIVFSLAILAFTRKIYVGMRARRSANEPQRDGFIRR